MILCSYHQKAIDNVPDTVRTYKHYLTPFVAWIVDSAKRGPISVTTQTVRLFMERQYRHMERDSYDRVYSQIVDFANQYLEKRIKRVKAIGIKKSVKKLQFPSASVAAVHRFLESQHNMLKDKPSTPLRRKQMAKCLGK